MALHDKSIYMVFHRPEQILEKICAKPKTNCEQEMDLQILIPIYREIAMKKDDWSLKLSHLCFNKVV